MTDPVQIGSVIEKEIAPRLVKVKKQSLKSMEQIKPGAFSSWFKEKKLKGGWFKCPHLIIAREELKSQAFRILITLISHARTKDICILYKETLIKETQLDKDTITKHSAWLKDNGWISWRKTGRAHTYLLLFKNTNPGERLKEFESASNKLLKRKAATRKDRGPYNS